MDTALNRRSSEPLGHLVLQAPFATEWRLHWRFHRRLMLERRLEVQPPHPSASTVKDWNRGPVGARCQAISTMSSGVTP